MLTDSSTKYRHHAWPRPWGRARRRMGAFCALSGGFFLSIACGGNADPSAARLGSIPQTCARLVDCLDQAQQQAECEEDLATKRTSATEAGCAAFYDEFLSCDEQHPGTCERSVRYELMPECARAADAVDDCIRDRGGPPQECSFGSGACPNPPCPNTCNIDCVDFAAECSGSPGQAMSCVCTEGAGAGRQFSTADCGSMNDDAGICR